MPSSPASPSPDRDGTRGGLLVAGLREPASLRDLPLAAWDLLVRQARRAGLLARLALLLDEAGLLASVPEKPRAHLLSERIVAEKHARDVRWELRCIERVLAPLEVPLVLLKGAAYLLAGLPAARGRVFTDIDLLVPRAALDKVEMTLLQNGWQPVHRDAYDQQYYRRWMHQIPPLEHFLRQTVLDVHHTIVPMTARIDIAAQRLFEAARLPAGEARLKVLAPADMVLHSATHLFNEGEFDRGLRDLADLDLLLRLFGRDAAFWPALLERAEQLDLARPLYYALRHAVRLLATPVPEAARAAVERLAPAAPLRRLMDALLAEALRPPHASCRGAASGLALWLLYVRAHHLRMPPHLLVPHLARKAVMGRLENWRGEK